MSKKHPEPKIVKPGDIDPRHDWNRPLMALGQMAVDFEERVDFRRLHKYRLGRTRQALAKSGLGAILTFDQHNIRYISSGLFQSCRGSMSPGFTIFGSAAKHHRLFAPWLEDDHCRAGLLGLRGAIHPDAGLFRKAADEIKMILESEGVAGMPLGVDMVELPMLFELQRLGIEVRDGQQMMLDAREIKSQDELMLLNMSAAMVDGTYQSIAEALKPGVRESQIVALANHDLYSKGSDCVEGINAISGERCAPHPHNFTDRLIRPGDQAFFDIIQSYMGYRTCYYRTFNVGRATDAQQDAYKHAREWIDEAIAMIRPGVRSDEVAACWPTADQIGFTSEMEAFGLEFGHGLGLGLHERPIISRLNSMEDPMEIKAGMVFALETYCPATDGISAARIEEEIVVTGTGCKVITLYPAETLPIANQY